MKTNSGVAGEGQDCFPLERDLAERLQGESLEAAVNRARQLLAEAYRDVLSQVTVPPARTAGQAFLGPPQSALAALTAGGAEQRVNTTIADAARNTPLVPAFGDPDVVPAARRRSPVVPQEFEAPWGGERIEAPMSTFPSEAHSHLPDVSEEPYDHHVTADTDVLPPTPASSTASTLHPPLAENGGGPADDLTEEDEPTIPASVLSFGARHTGTKAMVHIGPVPESTMAMLRQQVIDRVEGDRGSDEAFRLSVNRILTDRLLSYEWGRLLGVSGLPLTVEYRGKRYPISLRASLRATGPSAEQLDPMPDGPPVATQTWTIGMAETGDTAATSNHRVMSYAFNHTFPIPGSGQWTLPVGFSLNLTHNQFATNVAASTTTQPMQFLRSRGRHWPYDFEVTWELRLGDALRRLVSGRIPDDGWQPVTADGGDPLVVWFPTYLLQDNPLPVADPGKPETVPPDVSRLAVSDERLFGVEAFPQHDRLFADVMASFSLDLSEASEDALRAFFDEGVLRTSVISMVNGSVNSPLLYDRTGNALGYLRLTGTLSDTQAITGPTSEKTVLESYVLRSTRMQVSASTTNALGAGVTLGVSRANLGSEDTPRSGQITAQGGALHQSSHTLNSGGSARTAQSLRSAAPLLHVTPDLHARVTLIRADAGPVEAAPGTPMHGGHSYPLPMLVPSVVSLGHAPEGPRHLPPKMSDLRSFGITTTVGRVEGAEPLFTQAEQWLRDRHFLPPDEESPVRTDQAGRAMLLVNARKLDQMRSGLELRAAFPQMPDGGTKVWFEKPTYAGTERVVLTLTAERRHGDGQGSGNSDDQVVHEWSYPGVQTLNYIGSSIVGNEQFNNTPYAWNAGVSATVTNPLGRHGNLPLQAATGQYTYSRQTSRSDAAGFGSGFENYVLSPTENGVQRFKVPVTFRMTISYSHGEGAAFDPVHGSARLIVPTYETLDGPPTQPRPGPVVARRSTDADTRSLALPRAGRTYDTGVLRIPETALFTDIRGSGDLQKAVRSLLGEIEEEAARLAQEPLDLPGRYPDDATNTAGARRETPSTSSSSLPPPATYPPRRGQAVVPQEPGIMSPVWRGMNGFTKWVGDQASGVGRWLWQAAVGEPAANPESMASEAVYAALSPQHIAANALRIFRDSYDVEGFGTPGLLSGTVITVSVTGYLTNLQVLPQAPKMDAERWLQSTNTSMSTVTGQSSHRFGATLAGSYEAGAGSFTPSGSYQYATTSAEGVGALDNTGVFRVTSEDTTVAHRFAADAHYVVTVVAAGRTLAGVVKTAPRLEQTTVLDVPHAVEFLLMNNDLQNHPELTRLLPATAQAEIPAAATPDRMLPSWYRQEGSGRGTLGFAVVTEVHLREGRNALRDVLRDVVEEHAQGVTRPGDPAYVEGVLTRINEATGSVGLRTLPNAGPDGRSVFHFVHFSWLGPQLVEVALSARPDPTADLEGIRGRTVTSTSGMDNIYGHTNGDGGALHIPGATQISGTRSSSHLFTAAPAGQTTGGHRPKFSLTTGRVNSVAQTASSTRERRAWQRTFGSTVEFSRVPYEYVIDVSTRPLEEALLVRIVGTAVRSVLHPSAVVSLLSGQQQHTVIRHTRKSVPAEVSLRFNGAEAPVAPVADGTVTGADQARTTEPLLFRSDPRESVLSEPPQGSLVVEMEVPPELRTLLAAGPWVPSRPFEIYEFTGLDLLTQALREVDPSLRQDLRAQNTRSGEGLMIRIATLAAKGRITLQEPGGVAAFVGRPRATHSQTEMSVKIFVVRKEVTSKDTAIDHIASATDGFTSQVDSTLVLETNFGVSSPYGSADRGTFTVPTGGDHPRFGQTAAISSNRRELLRFGTPMVNAQGEGLTGHLLRAVAVVEVGGPRGRRWVTGETLLRVTETPPAWLFTTTRRPPAVVPAPAVSPVTVPAEMDTALAGPGNTAADPGVLEPEPNNTRDKEVRHTAGFEFGQVMRMTSAAADEFQAGPVTEERMADLAEQAARNIRDILAMPRGGRGGTAVRLDTDHGPKLPEILFLNKLAAVLGRTITLVMEGDEDRPFNLCPPESGR
ncbi:hypothetical protein [Actinacidiphila sp. bgisy167]|uniref:hypothetical protein n=1 Tax=Actinacidiphila sp. bgisy167 TaxID=3413797 RepID=UPI003D743FBD